MKSIIGIILLLYTGIAFACQCPSFPLSSKVNDADYIYLGMIIQGNLIENNKVVNTLKPIEVLKGTPDKWKLISNGGPIRRCSAIAAVGLRYVVYGRYGEDPKLSLCSPSYQYDPDYSISLDEIRKAANK
ncbi:MAG: hypothetical protein KZQ80_16565 [Candidatus Thiodiazotropha sp. (ex Monitilora ramsayi)]|nr:hypothetical protein [Candidatus Thiodiazotropha sp. (ex Monitilora ramsayi)]